MAAAFSMLFAKVAAVVAWFGSLWVAIFAALWAVVMDGFSWVFDQMLQIVVSALGALDVSNLTSYLPSVGSLTADLLNILGLLGVGTALGMIAAAIGIRLVLQLIPFTRLGS